MVAKPPDQPLHPGAKYQEQTIQSFQNPGQRWNGRNRSKQAEARQDRPYLCEGRRTGIQRALLIADMEPRQGITPRQVGGNLLINSLTHVDPANIARPFSALIEANF